MLTAVLGSKLIRAILTDYNFWPESEGDSPLKIARSKTALDEKAFLSRDASMRRAALKALDPAMLTYKPPARTLTVKTLDEVFKPLAAAALLEVQTGTQAVQDMTAGLETLEIPIEKSEFYVQLYSAFKLLANPKVTYVSDDAATLTTPDAYTGFFISGETTDGEVIIAQALLVQT